MYLHYEWLQVKILDTAKWGRRVTCEGKPEGKRPLGRPRRRWMNDMKMGLLEIVFNVVNWIGLAQDRYRWRALVYSVMNLRVP
jgi:hypothetical protein